MTMCNNSIKRIMIIQKSDLNKKTIRKITERTNGNMY